MRGHITERADNFAKRLVPPKAPVDNRTPEERMAAFHSETEPQRVKDARANARAARERMDV